ncbi:cold shock domain-containing protein [Nocardia sp. NPDC024068]|uniref:cold-shock protein n=1 Tax=Nocardia sp. NPDC024068 TaxID=3157197 RepID=UPI0033EA6883
MWRHGTVIWFDAQKGFGYLAPEDDIAPVYVEYRSIDATGYRTLFQGERVEFTSAQRAGGAEAVTVRRRDRTDATLPAAGPQGLG